MYAHYGANVYKIGYSGDAEERVHDFDTGYPESANIVYTFKHMNTRCLEQRVHKALDMFRLFPVIKLNLQWLSILQPPCNKVKFDSEQVLQIKYCYVL